MKHMMYFTMVALTVVLTTSCHREYKVVHARVPIDTMAHNDIKAQDPSTDELMMDDHLIDIPDIPQESDFENVSSRDLKEFDDYMKGL